MSQEFGDDFISITDHKDFLDFNNVARFRIYKAVYEDYVAFVYGQLLSLNFNCRFHVFENF